MGKIIKMLLCLMLVFTSVVTVNAEEGPVVDTETTETQETSASENQEEKSLVNYSVHELLYNCSFEQILEAAQLGNSNAIAILHEKDLAEEDYQKYLELKTEYETKLALQDAPAQEEIKEEVVEEDVVLQEEAPLENSIEEVAQGQNEEITPEEVITEEAPLEEVEEVVEEVVEAPKLMSSPRNSIRLLASPSGGGWANANSTTKALPNTYVRAFNSNVVVPVNYSNGQKIVWGTTKYADAPKIKFVNGIVIPDGDTYDLIYEVITDNINPSTDVWFGTGINEKNVLYGDSDVYKVAPTVGIAYTGPNDASHGNKRQNQVGTGDFEYRWYLEKNGTKVTDVPFVAGSRWISHNADHYNEYANIKTSGTIYTNGSWMTGDGMSGFSGDDYIYVMGESSNGEVVGYYTATEHSLVDGSYATNEQEVMFPKVNVYYKSDANGTITGKANESRIVTQKPTGSTDSPKANYEFKNWTVDKKVTLKDGTVINAGGVITEAQIKNIRLVEDITLTAHHQAKSTTKEETKEVTRTIRYWIEKVNGEKAFDTVVQKATFKRTNTYNAATNELISEGTWAPASSNLAKVDSPSKSGYSVDKASVPVKSVNASSGNEVVDVIYSPQYKITTKIDNGGTITPQINDIPKGDSRTVTWKPANNYYVVKVTIDGKVQNNPKEAGDTYTFSNMQKDGDVVVNTLPYHKITTAVVNGTIDPKIEKIKDGENKKIAYNPNPGYLLSTITVDGALVDILKTPSEYPFNNVKADHDIKVVYEKQPNPVKAVKNAEGEDINGQFVNKGDTLFYEITVTNTVAVDLEYTITDSLPDHTDLVSIEDGGTAQGKDLSWKVNVPANSSKTVHFSVKTLDYGAYSPNTAHLNVNHLGQVIDLDSNTVENWTPTPPVKKVLDEQGNDINGKYQLANMSIVYSIDVTNNSSMKKSFKVEDELPEGVRFDSADNNGQLVDGNKVEWNFDLEAGQSKTLNVFVTIEESAKDKVLVNKATQYVDKSVLDSNKVETPVLLEPVKAALDKDGNDINTKNVSNDAELTYKLTVHNAANEEKEFTFTDAVPALTDLVKVNDGGTVNEETGEITWAKSLKADETWTVSFVVKTNSFDSYIPNDAKVSVDEVEAKTNLVENYVPMAPIKKVIDENGNDAANDSLVAQHNRELTYKILFNNPSDHDVEVTITDELDEAWTYIESSDNGSYDPASRVITWKVSLPAHTEKYEVSVKVTPVATMAQTVLENDALVETELFSHKTNQLINYLIDDPTTIDLEGVKIWEDNNDKLGLRPSYIVVELLANGEPYRTQKVKGEGNEWKYSFTYLPKYMGGAEVKYSVSEYKAENYVTSIDGLNITNKVIPAPVKRVMQKGVDINNKPVIVGEEFAYEIEVENIFAEAKEFYIFDNIPQGLKVLEVSDDGKDIYNNVSWIVNVPANSKYTVSAKVKVLDSAVGTLINQAKVNVDGNKQDTNKVYNPISKLPAPIKAVKDEAGNDINDKAVKVDDILVYEIEVENPLDKALDITLSDKLPKGLEFIQADNNGKLSSDEIVWNLQLQAKEKKVVSFKVKVLESEQGLFENTAILKVGDLELPSNTVRNIKCCKDCEVPTEPKTYTVTFKDQDGKIYKVESGILEHGKATAPSVSKEGYKFLGWDIAFNDVTHDLVVTAKWEKANSQPVKEKIKVVNTAAK